MISALTILLSFYSFLLRTTLKTLTSALFVGLHSENFKLCVSNMIKRSPSAISSWNNNKHSSSRSWPVIVCSIFVEIYSAVAMSDFHLLWVHSLTGLPSSLIYGAEPTSVLTVQLQYKLLLSGKNIRQNKT